MPVRNARPGAGKTTTVSYRDARGHTRNARVLGTQGLALTDVDADPVGTGGALADGVYSYIVTYVRDGVESSPHVAVTAEIDDGGDDGSVEIEWPAVSGATSYNIYGRDAGTEELIDSVDAPTVTFVDDGSETPDGAPPTADGRLRLKDMHGKTVLTGKLAMAAPEDVDVYVTRY